MNCISIYWFGWCNTSNSDKIWAVLEIDGEYYTCYGRRGTTEDDLKKLKFTHLGSRVGRIQTKINNKKLKGYTESDVSVYPGFVEHLEQEMFYETLKGNI